MNEEINVTPPSDDFKVRMQDYVRQLTNLKYEIKNGRVFYMKDYVDMLELCGDELEPWLGKDKNKIDVLCEEANSMNTGLNKHRILNRHQFDDYFSKLKEIENILREVLKRENFLVKVAAKRMRLT